MSSSKSDYRIRQELLKEPFSDSEIEWRCQNAGLNKGKKTKWAQVVPFIQSRAIYDRLDSVLGIGGWATTYRETTIASEDGMICGIGIRFDGEWVWKYNGASCGNFEPIKSGCSNSIKRAAVEWGIGRYLYKQDMRFVDVMEGYPPDDGGHYVRIAQKQKGDRPAIYGYAVAPSQDLDKKIEPGQTRTTMQNANEPPDGPPPPSDADSPHDIQGMHQRAQEPPTKSKGQSTQREFAAKFDTYCTVCGEWHPEGTKIVSHGFNQATQKDGYAAVACIDALAGGR